jgi:CHAT domain-containing protein/Tfp pilus assembly protein PilF
VEAERDAEQFRISEPAWSTKLRLLEAQAMVWRGLNADALSILSGIAPTDPNDTIEKLVLDASVLTKLQQFPAAEQRLEQAESLCKATDLSACGGVLRARGVLAIDHGQVAAAREYFLESLSYARGHRDQFLESTALVNLAAGALQSDRYDEAVDWSLAAHRAALRIGAEDVAQAASGNLGWAYFELGDYQRALDQFLDAEQRAMRLGDLRFALIWLEDIGLVHQTDDEPEGAEPVFQQALALARRLDLKQDIVISLEDLAYASIDAGRLEEATRYLDQLTPLVKAAGNPIHQLSLTLARAQIAVARRQDLQAEDLLHVVETDQASWISFRLEAELDLARLYEKEGRVQAAESMYQKTLAAFEKDRAQLKNEESRLPFLANGESLYDSYIHFLISRGRNIQGLAIANRSRAQTLAEGLGLSSDSRPLEPSRINFGAIARESNATLLFYWLGKRTSYLWAITPEKTALFVLPPRRQIGVAVERYRKALMDAKDPLAEGNADARSLYAILVEPAADLIRRGSNVVVCVDGELSKLNFETLAVPEQGDGAHYWIEDATVVVAPSLSMLAGAHAARARSNNLLLIGDAVSSSPDYPVLPLASVEMRLIEEHFDRDRQSVFAGQEATPSAYLSSDLKKFTYVHFVAHGTASQTDPLESAIILSPDSSLGKSFKLYARDVIRHPIDARLVTISACYGSGARTFSGEGLVGLSWSFLRAGAHNVIGTLWNVSDESTPRIMNHLYEGIEDGRTPGEALRNAKLELLRSPGEFHKPFYWASFELYSGR